MQVVKMSHLDRSNTRGPGLLASLLRLMNRAENLWTQAVQLAVATLFGQEAVQLSQMLVQLAIGLQQRGDLMPRRNCIS